jgi:hypothetical protein
LAYLDAYQQACDDGTSGGAYRIKPGEKIGKPTAEQAEVGRLHRQLEVVERKLARTAAALSIMEKARLLFGGHLRKRGAVALAQETLMSAYATITLAEIPRGKRP